MSSDPDERAVRNYLASLSDPDTFRRAFVQHAKAWAEAERIPSTAFLQMGVPPEVLHEAGLTVSPDVNSDDARPAATRRADVVSTAPENGAPVRREAQTPASAVWRRWTICGMTRRFYRMMSGHQSQGGSHPRS
jgi:hypothetical protein